MEWLPADIRDSKYPSWCANDGLRRPHIKPDKQPAVPLILKNPWVEFRLGILNMTVSPNSATLELVMRPFIISNDVFPPGLILHRVMRQAACLTNQGIMVSPKRTLFFNLFSRAAGNVRACSSTSWIARSTEALESDSPTDASSMAVPNSASRCLAISLSTETADVSWSDLRCPCRS